MTTLTYFHLHTLWQCAVRFIELTATPETALTLTAAAAAWYITTRTRRTP
jgi:hypothetical protein